MARLYEVQLRHSEHYLRLLRAFGDKFAEGKESLKSAIAQYESESENIEVGFAWAQRHSAKDTKAADLCAKYPNAAPYLLDFRQQPLERIRWLEAALAASQSLKQHDAEDKQLLSLGVAYLRLGEIKNAVGALGDALVVSQDIGDRDAEAEALSHLGKAFIDSGQLERGLRALEHSLSISREVGNLRTKCNAFNGLGQAHYALRDFQRAIDYYTDSLSVATSQGYLPEESIALTNLGRTYAILNRPRKAIETHEKSLRIAREIGDKRSEVRALASIGQANYLLGNFEDAITFLQSALPLARQQSDGVVETEIVSILGDSYLEMDQADLAIEYYKQRITIKRLLGHDRILAIEHTLLTEGALSAQVEIEGLARPEGTKPNESDQVLRGTTTWLHLSDLHFQKSSTYHANVVLQPLLDDIDSLKQTEGLSPDFAFITGDIAFSGKPDEYAIACEFLEELRKVTGLSQENVFIVPGNHDVDSSLVEPLVRSMGKSITDHEAYDQLLESPQFWKQVLRRFKGWSEFFDEHFDGGQKFDEGNYYYVKTLNLEGTRITLLGLNSVWLSHPEDDRRHRLVLGERQVRAALETAKNSGAHIRIALMHHPQDWLREFDRYEAWDYLFDKCDFVLHGHLHHPGVTQLWTPNNQATVIAGGACYATRQYPNSYNIVRLDLASNTGIIYFRTYSDNRGGFWAPDTRLYKNVSDGRYKFTLPNFSKPD